MTPLAYVVIGVTGEYSDRSEWLVRAFDTEQAAIDFAQTCNSFARNFPLLNNDEDDHERRDRLTYALRHGLDPSCERIDYTGVDYWVRSCPWGAP